MTWTQMVRDLVMNKEYDRLGVTVSKDELFDLVQGKNPHQYILQYFKDPNTNQYNPQLVINFLKQLDQVEPEQKKNWLILEKAIKDDRLQNKFNTLISKAYYLPKVFAEMDYQDKNRKYHVKVVASRYQAIDDKTINIADEDWVKYYDENKYKYMQDEETRDIDYVTFDLVASDADRKFIEEEVTATWNEFQKAPDVAAFVSAYSDTRYDSSWRKPGTLLPRIDSLAFNAAVGTFLPPFMENNAFHMAKLQDVQMRPDSMKASHILVSFQGSAVNDPNVKRNKDAARLLADSVLNAVKKDPNLFVSLAAKYSDDGSNKTKGGSLDWFVDGAMVYPFNKAVLDGKVGDITLVETVFGFHIIRVDGKTLPIRKARVAVVDRKIEPGSQTIRDIYNQASEFAGENTTLDAFQKACTDKGYNKRSADMIRAMESTLPGLTGARGIIQWAFFEETPKGSVSTVFEIEGSYVVATLKEIRPKGIPTLEQIKKQIEPLVKREKKAEKLIADFKKVNAADLYDLATKLNLKVDTVPGVIFYSPNLPKFGPEPKVVGTIATMKTGQKTDPLQGEQAVYVVQLDSIAEAPKVEDLKMYTNQAQMMFGNRAQQEAYKALEKMAGLVDNRTRFY